MKDAELSRLIRRASEGQEMVSLAEKRLEETKSVARKRQQALGEAVSPFAVGEVVKVVWSVSPARSAILTKIYGVVEKDADGEPTVRLNYTGRYQNLHGPEFYLESEPLYGEIEKATP